ncbi:MAG: T9SS type A sorting domain-containing protein [Chitinophagaceae bacterium]|nr:T9SS type A sorting domain-containing protein [Chitinophagaceae bacterium]MBP6214830.1 T9SS type A sorting domain-containing protein [Chitinophagaceae bacterium]
MRKIYFLLNLMLFATINVFAQSEGDYRSRSDGNWNSTNRWQRYIGGSWTNVTDYPGQNAGAGTVTIMDGDDVTLNISPSNSIGALIIEGGGNDSELSFNSGLSLNVSGAITIGAGTGNNDDKIISVGSGTLSCASIIMAATNDDNRDCEITISTGTVTVTGDITMNGTAARNAIRFSGAGTLNVGGSISSGGDIVPNGANGGLVNYNGTSGTQTVKSDTYADITFSGGATKTIAAGGIIITDDATFTSGIVNSSVTNSITFNDNAATTGANDASFVNGPIVKNGNDAFDFPVGTIIGGNRYHPISIGAPSASTTFEAEYIRASSVLLEPDLNTGVYAVSACEYWRLDRTGASATADVTLYWNEYSPCGGAYITTLTGLIVAWRDPADSRWENSLGGPQTVTSISPFTTGTLLRTSVEANGFGYFTFGSANINGSPLPVKLSNIRAFEKQQGIQIDWTAYQEDNLSRYQVERSADGQTFMPVGDVAARNLVIESNYSFFDANPLPGVNFYRLKNIDLDGKSGYSNVVKVNLDKNIKGFTLYPNPVRSAVVSFQSSDLSKGNYSVNIFNANGQQVYAQRFNHSGGSVNQTLQLPAGVRSGMYTMQLNNGTMKVMSKTFMVQ